MRILYLFLSLILFIGNIYGQPETQSYRLVSDKFMSFYNTNNYDSIFDQFSNEMKNFLPLAETKNFFTNTTKQLGQLIRKEFIKYNKSAVYKGFFENGLYNIHISVNDSSKINGLSITPFTTDNSIKRNKTNLSLPFSGAWNIVWGGDTKEVNYHVESQSQKNAFDILIQDKTGKTWKNDGKNNEDYYAFWKKNSGSVRR